MSVVSHTITQRPKTGRRTRRRRSTVVAGTAAAAAATSLAISGMGVDLEVGSGTEVQRVGLAAIVASSLVAGLAAWGALVAFERWTVRSRRNWLAACAAVLVVSMTGPLTEAADAATSAGLVALHVVTAGTLVVGMTWPWGRDVH